MEKTNNPSTALRPFDFAQGRLCSGQGSGYRSVITVTVFGNRKNENCWSGG
jgi:hypothetical protein